MKMLKKRNSTFELLRIISILLIIIFHYSSKGGYVGNTNPYSIGVFLSFGELGVNLFMLITGYYMINTNRKWEKVILILAQVYFYNIINSTIVFLNSGDPYTINNVIKILIPNTFYWYIKAYLLIYIFSPYINKLLKTLTQKDYIALLTISLVIWSVIPSFLQILGISAETTSLFYNRFIWLLIVYCIGAYINLYVKDTHIRKSLMFFSAATLLLLVYIGIAVTFQVGFIKTQGFIPPNSVLLFFLSLAIFLLFAKISPFNSRTINLFANCTLGIYMLHDGYGNKLIRTYCASFFTGQIGELNILLSSIVIFLVGFLLNIVWIFVEKFMKLILDFVTHKIQKKVYLKEIH